MQHLVFDDVADVSLDRLAVKSVPESAALVRVHDTRDALVRGCQVETPGTFLEVAGTASRNIVLTNNQIRAADQIVLRDGATDDAVTGRRSEQE